MWQRLKDNDHCYECCPYPQLCGQTQEHLKVWECPYCDWKNTEKYIERRKKEEMKNAKTN